MRARTSCPKQQLTRLPAMLLARTLAFRRLSGSSAAFTLSEASGMVAHQGSPVAAWMVSSAAAPHAKAPGMEAAAVATQAAGSAIDGSSHAAASPPLPPTALASARPSAAPATGHESAAEVVGAASTGSRACVLRGACSSIARMAPLAGADRSGSPCQAPAALREEHNSCLIASQCAPDRQVHDQNAPLFQQSVGLGAHPAPSNADEVACRSSCCCCVETQLASWCASGKGAG